MQGSKYENVAQINSTSETSKDFMERLISDKYRLGLSWKDIAWYMKEFTGIVHDESYYRKNFAKLVEYNVSPYVEESSNEIHDSFYDAKTREQILAIQKERIKLSDERTQNNAYIRRISREDTIKEIAHAYALEMANKKPLLAHPSDSTWNYRYESNEAILCLSDWHYGIEFKNAWNSYNTEIARNRIDKLYEEVVDKCIRNNVKHINVLNLADMIAGRIHLTIRLESRIDVVTQTMEVSEILAEFLSNLSEHFDVCYYSCLDNHSRIEPIKADSMDLESLCRITDWYLKERLQKYKNIVIHDNYFGNDIITFTCKGFNILGIHGHKDKPSSVIESISAMTNSNYDLICMAHRHHFSADEQTGTMLVCNGSLMGTDTFATNLRLWSKPSQNLIIVSDNNVTEVIYKINL